MNIEKAKELLDDLSIKLEGYALEKGPDFIKDFRKFYKIIGTIYEELRIKNMEKLKPCPFCGHKKPMIEGTTKGFLVVECRQCGATMHSIRSVDERMDMGHEKVTAEVIAAWNKRG